MSDALYQKVTRLAAPLISFYLRRRLAQGREDKARFPERLGQASAPRPEGTLVWLHAASVGEAMSALSLIEAFRTRRPDVALLLTTGTVSSARLMEKRLPPGVLHQYIPVDTLPAVTSFLDHWHPDAILWMESELWPTMLSQIRARKIPAVLLNGRLSKKSFGHWLHATRWIAEILSTFRLVLAQTEAEADRFRTLGATDVRFLGNLKYAAAPLSCDKDAFLKLRAQIDRRPVWLMASTHPGEDEIALKAHLYCQNRHEDLLTIILPRHAPRGAEIARLARRKGLTVARRSQDEIIDNKTSIYIADTMGETGLFYRLAPLVCIAGSFTWGGHNPIEAAQQGCAIVFGPRMTNFETIASDFTSEGGAIQVRDTDRLCFVLASLLQFPSQRERLGMEASRIARQKQGVLDEIWQVLLPCLPKESA